MAPSSLPRARALVAVLAALAVVAGATTAAVFAVTHNASPATPLATASGLPLAEPLGPVVLVPGYGGDAASLAGLAAKLRANGRDAHVLALPDGGVGDFGAQQKALAAEISRLRAAGADPVDVVGYSAGGVVAALYALEHGRDGDVRRIVSIGAPLHGTTVASTAAQLAPKLCSTACRQLAPGSAIVAEAAKADPDRTGIPWLSMWSTRDQVVTPPDSARLTGAVNVPLQSVCADDQTPHTSLPTDPLVVGLVLVALGRGALNAPGSAACASLRAHAAES